MLIQCLGLEEAHTTVRGETDANFQLKHLFIPAQETLLAQNSAGGFLLLLLQKS